MGNFLNRLFGRTDPESEAGDPDERLDDDRSEVNADHLLGGFDPQELIETDEPPKYL